jgi:hypothetical protein
LGIFDCFFRQQELKHRVDVLKELITNESKYISLLGSVVDCAVNMRKWVRSEQEKERKGKMKSIGEAVTEIDVRGIFGEIEIIYNTHCVLLQKMNGYKSKKFKV